MTFAYVLHGVLEKISGSNSIEWNGVYITNVRFLSPEERKSKGIYDFISATNITQKYKTSQFSEMTIDNENGTVTEIYTFIDMPIDVVKDLKKKELANLRYTKEVSGLEINGSIIKTDRESQATLTGAYVKVQLNPDTLIDWKSDSGWIQLDKITIETMASLVGTYVQTCFSNERLHSEAIDLITTYEEVCEYDITTGW